MNQTSSANSAFWNELCGSTTAQRLGITDRSKESLERFDAWYFRMYPYLDRHIPFDSLPGKSVLEVGLGYGSVSQKLAEQCSDYQGLDIADGPVEMVNFRLSRAGLRGKAQQGDVLNCPFDNNVFDAVVAIGCYHHTGDVARAVAETWRVLKPGGFAVVMVYNAYSYRRWLRWPISTLQYFFWDYLGVGAPGQSDETERAAYDANTKGTAAPETDFLSRRHVQRISSQFRLVQCWLENADPGPFRRLVSRNLLLSTIGKVAGLDVYIRLEK